MENSKKVKTKENSVEKVDKALNSNPLKKRADKSLLPENHPLKTPQPQKPKNRSKPTVILSLVSIILTHKKQIIDFTAVIWAIRFLKSSQFCWPSWDAEWSFVPGTNNVNDLFSSIHGVFCEKLNSLYTAFGSIARKIQLLKS